MLNRNQPSDHKFFKPKAEEVISKTEIDSGTYYKYEASLDKFNQYWGEKIYKNITQRESIDDLLKYVSKLGDKNIKYPKHGKPLVLVAILAGATEHAKALINAGCDIENGYSGSYNILTSAVKTGDIDLCKLLIEAGSDVNTIDSDGNTPLMVAAENDEMSNYLLGVGAKPLNLKKYTPVSMGWDY